MQFLKALEYPVREIYLDAVWIENFSIEFVDKASPLSAG
jgi:hypothetical protein